MSSRTSRYAATSSSSGYEASSPTSASTSIAYSPYNNGFQPTSYPSAAPPNFNKYSISEPRTRIPSMYAFTGPRVVYSGSSYPLLQPKSYVSYGAAQPIVLGEYKIGLTIAGIFGAFRVHDKHARPVATQPVVATISVRHHLPAIATNPRYRGFPHDEQHRLAKHGPWLQRRQHCRPTPRTDPVLTSHHLGRWPRRAP